jgi:ketosteroid isomerase-like protein
VRSIVAAWERGDYSSVEWADPESEVVVVDGPSPGNWRGVAGIAESTRDFTSVWEGYRGEADEFCELDDERVLVLINRSGRGKTSELDLGQLRAKGASVFHVRDGKVTRTVVYFDRERGLAELGLKE